MTIRGAIFVLALLFGLAATYNVYAVGYERYPANGAEGTQCKSKPATGEGLAQAVKKATFLEKVPAALDQVAFFVRDVLGQFGLGKDADEAAPVQSREGASETQSGTACDSSKKK